VFVIPNTQMTYTFNESPTIPAEAFFATDVIATIHTYAGIMLFITVGFAAAMFFTTRYMLKNRLNLQ
jgi:hypothetical protein